MRTFLSGHFRWSQNQEIPDSREAVGPHGLWPGLRPPTPLLPLPGSAQYNGLILIIINKE